MRLGLRAFAEAPGYQAEVAEVAVAVPAALELLSPEKGAQSAGVVRYPEVAAEEVAVVEVALEHL